MKVVVVGTGYVGLVSGACLAQLGNDIVCVDKDSEKINKLNNGIIPIYEPNLEKIVNSNKLSGKLKFTTNLKESLQDVGAVLLAVGTPDKNGEADLSFIFSAAKEIADNLSCDTAFITKSTVPVGTGCKLLETLNQQRQDLNFNVISNPEFLREGSAVEDFLNPDRVVIGSNNNQGKELMQKLYCKLIDQGTPILFTNIETAELIKYASNAFLATKISFVNEISDICEGVGADIKQVLNGMGMDARIGNKYMNPGPGFGGSCFPKDTLALTNIAKKAGFPSKIVESVIDSNDRRKVRMSEKIINASNGDVKGKTIAIWGLAFKANTDDMRYSSSLVIIPELIKAGAKIKAYDPESMDESKKILNHDSLEYCQSSLGAVTESDFLVVLTEWQEFIEFDTSILTNYLKDNLVVDLRNIWHKNTITQNNLKYINLG